MIFKLTKVARGNVCCPQIMIPTNETLLPNKLPGGHHSVDVDNIHGKNKLLKMRNTRNKTGSHQVLESRPMKRYYPTNCPGAIIVLILIPYMAK